MTANANWYFPLLAHKAGVRTFDVSSGMNYVSVKDQVVRATVLVNSLLQCKLFDGERKQYDVVVIGAGVAGVAAASHAAGHGLKVLVLEGADERFPLQKKCTSRHVSFSMYDWPEAHAAKGVFPSLGDMPVKSEAGFFFPCSVLSEHPVPASELVTGWDREIEGYKYPSGSIRWEFGVKVTPPSYRGNALLVDDRDADAVTIHFRHTNGRDTYAVAKVLIFATGIGTERTVPNTEKPGSPYQPPSFWSDLDDAPWQEDVDLSERTAFLSGNGDGAIQDFLKIVYRKAAINLLALVEACKLSLGQMARIVSAERHVARQLMWNTPVTEAYAALQVVFDEIVAEVLAAHKDPLDVGIAEQTCPKIVWVAETAEPAKQRIVFSKTYALNRFLATLTLAKLRDSPKLRLVAGQTNSVHKDEKGVHRCKTSSGTEYRSDFAPLLRHGVDKNTGLGSSADYFGLRSALAGAPLPFKPSDFPVKPI